MARDENGHWLKGTSGNPGGKGRALEEVHELARAHTPKSIEVLAQIRDDRRAPAQARVAACLALLDRAWGKPPQSISAEITATQFRKAIEMTDDELANIATPDTATEGSSEGIDSTPDDPTQLH